MPGRWTSLAAAALAPLLSSLLSSPTPPPAAPSAPRTAPPAARCRLLPLPFGRAPVVTYFVGTALADTMLAGAGPVAVGAPAGMLAAVHGQLVRVDTIGGAGDGRVRRLLDWRGTRDVVVVPWGYDDACRPVPWDSSARWVEPGLTGFYTVSLRPESQWVDRRPTFDAYAADLDPYPHGAYYRRGLQGTAQLRRRASLDAREMFALYDALPPHGRRDDAALARLRAWAAANPALAAKYPADAILREALRGEGRRR